MVDDRDKGPSPGAYDIATDMLMVQLSFLFFNIKSLIIVF